MRDYFQRSRAILLVIPALLVLILLCAAPVSAATVDITLSGDIAAMPLKPGQTNSDTSVTLTVVLADVPFYVKVKDDMSGSKTPGSAGQMVDYATPAGPYGPAKLATAIGVTGTTSGTTEASAVNALSGTDQTLYTGSEGVTNQVLALSFNQLVAYTDRRLGAGHVYRIRVLFTASPK